MHIDKQQLLAIMKDQLGAGDEPVKEDRPDLFDELGVNREELLGKLGPDEVTGQARRTTNSRRKNSPA